MSSNTFRFKEFEVIQEHSAMKVGTDGVLVAAWATEICSMDGGNILDIGTGTGLIALIAAQECVTSKIVAVEIDEAAAKEAKGNFERSKWSERLTCEQCSIQEFAVRESNRHKFSSIITNPPYFINSLKNEELSKVVARHTELLPYEELVVAVKNLLADDGNFFLILPYEESGIFVTIAAINGIYLRRRMDVYGSQRAGKIKRSMMMFSLTKGDTATSSITVRQGDGFSQKYMELTKSLYLKF